MNHEHAKILFSGVEKWNEWRKDNPYILPDLAGAVLHGADLQRANLARADLTGTYLAGADLRDAIFNGADLTGAYLAGAHLMGAIFNGANLTNAILWNSFLTGANFNGANLRGAILNDARLSRVTFTDIIMNWSSHILIGTRLHQAALYAGDIDYYQRIALAGAILTNAQHCWGYWLKVDIPESVKEWALNLMATWVRDGDDAPEVLTERVKTKEKRYENMD